MTRIRDDYDYEAEDIRHDDDVVRKMDDADETLAKAQRNAAGISPEILSLQDAFSAGQRSGYLSHGASMNPYQDHTPEHAEWERGRMGALEARLNPERKVA